MLREFPAVVDEEQMAIPCLVGHPRIDQETARNPMVGHIVVGEFHRIRGRRACYGVGHVHGEGLILCAEAAKRPVQLGGCGKSCELAREDVRRDCGQRDKEYHRREAHQQVGDDQAIAHLPQHVVDEPAIEDDATEDHPDRDDEDQPECSKHADQAGHKAKQDENEKRRGRPEGAVLRHAGECGAAQRIQNSCFCAREKVWHAQAEV